MKTIQKELIENHFIKSVKDAEMGKSKLGDNQKEVYGTSGDGVRNFINNICSLSILNTYAEFGVYRGASFLCAMYNNKNITNAYGFDNYKYDAISPDRWKEDGHPNVKSALEQNIWLYKERWHGEGKIILFEDDFIKETKVSDISKKIDVVFYDAGKVSKNVDELLQKYKPVLDKHFIIAFTDFSDVGIKNTVENSIKNNNYVVHLYKLYPDTGPSITGRTAIGMYYLENKITVKA